MESAKINESGELVMLDDGGQTSITVKPENIAHFRRVPAVESKISAADKTKIAEAAGSK